MMPSTNNNSSSTNNNISSGPNQGYRVVYYVVGVHYVKLTFKSKEHFENWNINVERLKTQMKEANEMDKDSHEYKMAIFEWYAYVEGMFRPRYGDELLTEDIRQALIEAGQFLKGHVKTFGPAPEIIDPETFNVNEASNVTA